MTVIYFKVDSHGWNVMITILFHDNYDLYSDYTISLNRINS